MVSAMEQQAGYTAPNHRSMLWFSASEAGARRL